MSRIGKQPVPVPEKVDVSIDGTMVRVKGPLGQLERNFRDVSFEQADGAITVVPASQGRVHRAMWGLGRTLLNLSLIHI